MTDEAYPEGSWTLDETRAWLRARVDEGRSCPCCTQFAKVYRRKLNSGMARSLLTMYSVGRTDWMHLPTAVGARSREEGKLQHWGLVEPHPTKRGFWRVTWLGDRFLHGQVRVASHVILFNGNFMGYVGTEVTIHECLPKGFDLTEVLAPAGVA